MGRRNSAAERGQGGGCVFEREKKAERERERKGEKRESNLIRRQDCGNLLILPFLRLSNLFLSFYPLFLFFFFFCLS